MNESTLSRPPLTTSNIHKVAILFAGGPAPAANAVISTAASSFLRNNIEVVGVMYGYSRLVEFGPDHPLQEGRDFVSITPRTLKRTRNTQGIMIGTARTNPGKNVSSREHLADPERTKPLRAVHAALRSINVDALISIQQVPGVSAVLAGRLAAHPGGARPQNDRQRLHGDRFHVRLLHGGRNAGQ
jgi:ATP-dependent phosphofructokinase / diphosphate-dependent phosphofructokinase